MKKFLYGFVVFGFLFFTTRVYADMLGPSYPHTASTFGSGGVDWNNPGRIKADDGLNATVNLPFPLGDSNHLSASNYGFAIPTNATITGIEVAIERKSSAATLGLSVKDKVVKLIKNGSPVGEDKSTSTNWTTTFHVAHYGSPTDLWNTTWTPEDINAENFGVSLSVRSEALLTPRIASVNYVRVTVSYSLPTTGSLTVTKTTVGGDGTFSFTESTLGSFSLTTLAGTISKLFENLTPGTFSVAEDPQTGWDMTSNDCTNLNVTAGAVSNCTIVNTKRASITVHKHILAVDSESSTDDDQNFAVTVNGSNEQVFSKTMPYTYDNLVPGTYTIAEIVDPDYDFVGYSLDEDEELNGAQITLSAGQHVDITVTNRQKPANLTVITHVDNTHGIGTKTADEFTILLDAHNPSLASFPGSEEGTTVTLHKGAYNVSEQDSMGYAMGTSSGCSGFAASNESITCLITNYDITPGKGALIVRKNLINDDGGTAEVSEFHLFRTSIITRPGIPIVCVPTEEVPCPSEPVIPMISEPGPDLEVVSGAVSELDPGTYSVFESQSWDQSKRYTHTGTVCTDNSEAIEGSTISLQAGHVYICTITNDDKPAKLRIIKSSQNPANSGNADGTFSFSLSGRETPITLTTVEGHADTTLELHKGKYTLSENEDPNWNIDEILCSVNSELPEEVFENNFTFSVDNGDSVYCTYSNLHKVGRLMVKKVVVNNNGGDKVATDFSFQLNGGEPMSFNREEKFSEEETNLEAARYLLLETGTSYTVTEPQTPNYVATFSGDCTNVMVNESTPKTCVITNTYTPPNTGGAVGVQFLTNPVTNPNPTVANTPTPQPVGQVLGAETCSTEYLRDYMFYGKKNDPAQVKLLQEFLNENLGTTLPLTGLYGRSTRDKVKEFQVKYATDVLSPWMSFGLASDKVGTGNVYKTTKWKINMLKCGDLKLPQPELP
jgi:hypothetical protein